MFLRNQKHLQKQFFTAVDGLPKRQVERLLAGWSGVFYSEFFSRIDEQPYAVLYSTRDSRPNVPVNVLVGLEALKSGFNWSDEEMYDQFCFDLQIRFALGYKNLGDGQFDLRTVYNFRHRLAEHMQKTGVNLIEQSFERISDEQIEFFKLKTGKVRMDSSQIASNIRNMSRLHLLVEVLQRVHRMLSDNDRTLYADVFAAYVKGTSNQYVYRVKGEDGAAHMQRIGEVMQQMLESLAAAYSQHATYQMLARVFAEHFLIEQERLRLKTGKELSSASLQSPDDMEATFQSKNNRSYKGYVTNITETCDPENPVQLIAKVQTKPNVTNDDDMLIEAIPSLKERLDIAEVHTDGGYNSDESFKVLRDNGIELIQTAIRGHSPHEHLGLDQFQIATASAKTSDRDPNSSLNGQCHDAANQPDPGCDLSAAGQCLDMAKEPALDSRASAASQCAISANRSPIRITCPHGQTVDIERVENRTEYKRYRAHFDAGRCFTCPFKDKCPASEQKSKRQRTLSFDERDVEIARRRQRIAHDRQAGTNLRVTIESTIASLKQPFNYDQLPVRGIFRVAMTLIGCAALVNVRRIYRYLSQQTVPEGPKGNAEKLESTNEAATLFFLPSVSRIQHFFDGFRRYSYAF